MDKTAELEIRLDRAAEGGYALDFLFHQPGNAPEARLLGDRRVLAHLDAAKLGEPLGNPAGYGQKLAAQLFSLPAALAFTKAVTAAQTLGAALRLRLNIAPGAADLHHLAWELLCDTEDGAFLSTRDWLVFTRVMARAGTGAMSLPVRGGLSALLAVAKPTDPKTYDLADLDADAEVQRVQGQMTGINVVTATGKGKPAAALENLVDALSAGPAQGFDVFYLVCHGRNTPKGYVLYLEDQDRMTRPVRGEEVISALQRLANPPRLLVTTACQSAEAGANGAGFAARLAEAGLAAVLAMQTPFSLPTEARFMPVFFRELAEHGFVDGAAAAARRAVIDRGDFWVPALFTCLRDGKIWRDPANEQAAKYQVNVEHSSGTVIGDGNTITQNFD